jgi:hypothetical protein
VGGRRGTTESGRIDGEGFVAALVCEQLPCGGFLSELAAMKTSHAFRVALIAMVAAGVTGSARAELAGGAVAAVPVSETAPTLKLPDFKTASVADLAGIASQALSGLGQVATSAPGLLEKVTAVKTALSAGQASQALTALAGLGAAAKNIPGAAALADTATQLVSAWALKQGFDAAKISGVLGALQKKDLSALTSKATSLLAKDGVTDDQQGLLKGVLNAYGIDASKAAGAAGALKGFFGN